MVFSAIPKRLYPRQHFDTVSAGGANKPYATIVVAAYNSRAPDAANADYVCDGTADNVEIQAAIDACVGDFGADGGKVVLLEGHYTISTGIVVDVINITIEGMGKATVLFGSAGVNVLSVTDPSISDVQFRSLTVDGGETGIRFAGGTNFCQALNVWVEDCDQGIQLDDCSHCTVAGCHVTACNEVGIELTSAGALRCLVAENYVRANYKHGIVVAGNDNSIFGNYVYANSQLTNNTYDGIRLGSALRCAVQGNVVRKPSAGSGQHKYGINVTASSTDAFVTNNDLKTSASTASFNDAGTGTITAAGNRT